MDSDNLRSFRILDEEDLCNFWEKYPTGNGWLARVFRGGWYDLESTRADFITPHNIPNEILEFLMVCDACVSVLSICDPTITDLGDTASDSDKS